MAYIEPRKNSKGKITSYRLVVSEGFKPNGDRIKRCAVWTPPRPNMTAKQMEKEATAAAIKFEEQIKIGLRIDNDIKFHEYANYVLGIKEQAGVRPTTLDRYIEMLPRINEAIGHLSLTKIRPEHLNEFYRDLLTNSVCKNKSRAYSKGELLRTLADLGHWSGQIVAVMFLQGTSAFVILPEKAIPAIIRAICIVSRPIDFNNGYFHFEILLVCLCIRKSHSAELPTSDMVDPYLSSTPPDHREYIQMPGSLPDPWAVDPSVVLTEPPLDGSLIIVPRWFIAM